MESTIIAYGVRGKKTNYSINTITAIVHSVFPISLAFFLYIYICYKEL